MGRKEKMGEERKVKEGNEEEKIWRNETYKKVGVKLWQSATKEDKARERENWKKNIGEDWRGGRYLGERGQEEMEEEGSQDSHSESFLVALWTLALTVDPSSRALPSLSDCPCLGHPSDEAPLTKKAEPGLRGRLGAYPWTNPSSYALQPLWLGMTVNVALALCLWKDAGSNRHY